MPPVSPPDAAELASQEKTSASKNAAAAPETIRSVATSAPAASLTGPAPRTLSKIIQENTQFFSSVVIGGAGLIATSIYQCNQSNLAQSQARWQQKRDEEKSNNDWRIERAKILAQNLATLTTRGSDTAEQRYGVLLSLTRSKIIERDLAVSYALELGKDSAEDMRSVLNNIDGKDVHYYKRLAEAYTLTCKQRYGIGVPSMEICRKDKLEKFSQGIAWSVSDDLDGTGEQTSSPPLDLLTDEHYVQGKLAQLIGLYSEFVDDVCERRQWQTLDRFLNSSTGARLVGNFNVLLQPLDQTNLADQQAARQRFEGACTWLKGYLLGASCDGECRARILSVSLSYFSRNREYFAKLLRALLQGQRFEASSAINRMHGRLNACQFEPDELPALRDMVLIPVLIAQAEKVTPSTPITEQQALLDELLGLLQLMAPPPDSSADWKKLQVALSRATSGREPKQYLERHAEEQRRRKAVAAAAAAAAATAANARPKNAVGPVSPPPPAPPAFIQGRSFCSVVSQYEESEDEAEE